MISVAIYGKELLIPSLFRLPMYYHYLVETLKMFDQWAEEFPQCAIALRDPALVTDLAIELDRYAAQQLVAEVNRCFVPQLRGIEEKLGGMDIPTFLQYCYCRHCLLEGASPENFSANVIKTWRQDFLDLESNEFRDFKCFRPVPESYLHPITLLAVRHLSESLWNGIARLCRRIHGAFADLGHYFFEGDRPCYLLAIQPQSHWRHRGGGRALTLLFQLKSGQFQKLAYQPFDLEEDFLLLGDTDHARRLLDSGLLCEPIIVESLAWLQQRPIGFSGLIPNFNRIAGTALPMRKILPCVPGSALIEDDQGRVPQIREPYGFHEYLEGEDPAGAQSEEAGQIAALIQIFGIGPFYPTSPEHPSPAIRVCGNLTGLDLETSSRDVALQPPNSPDHAAIQTGLRRIQQVLAAHASEFITWLSGLEGIIIRMMPYPLQELERVVFLFHRFPYRFHQDGTPLVVDVAAYESELTHYGLTETADWVQRKSNLLHDLPDPATLSQAQLDQLWDQLQPCFCIFASRAMVLDGIRGDVPAFYHRLGTRELMGSDGSLIRFSLPNPLETSMSRAMSTLYGQDRLKNAAYFHRNSLSMIRDRLIRLAEQGTEGTRFISKP